MGRQPIHPIVGDRYRLPSKSFVVVQVVHCIGHQGIAECVYLSKLRGLVIEGQGVTFTVDWLREYADRVYDRNDSV
jgi:hypothetical protein